MRVVITGANSYIGNSLEAYTQSIDKGFEICQLDVIGEAWRTFDFSGYDAVVHVAAIVHRKDSVSWEEYQAINTDLTAEIAEKAKNQGVRQFVFLSSMAVYGVEKALSPQKSIVTADTPLNPTSMYGKSKLLAEERLAELESEDFKVAVVRPPNVYGPGCRGGYISTYKSIVSKLPFIPKAYTSVKQSVLFIDNLSRFIYLLITQKKRGVYTPQDDTGVSAVEIMEYIGEALELRKKANTFFGFFVPLLSFSSLVRKGYGGISYDPSISHQDEFDYVIVSVKEGIQRTVLYGNKHHHSGV